MLKAEEPLETEMQPVRNTITVTHLHDSENLGLYTLLATLCK